MPGHALSYENTAPSAYYRLSATLETSRFVSYRASFTLIMYAFIRQQLMKNTTLPIHLQLKLRLFAHSTSDFQCIRQVQDREWEISHSIRSAAMKRRVCFKI